MILPNFYGIRIACCEARWRAGGRKVQSYTHTYAIGYKYGGGCEALLRMAGDIRHPNSDNKTAHATKDTRDRISNDRSGSMESPLALPDDRAAGDDRKTAEDQHDNTDIGYTRAEPAGREDDDEAERPERELEEDRVERAPPEGGDDQGAEARHGPVHGVRRRHHDGDEPDLDVEDGLPQLRGLEPRAADAGLAAAQALDGGEPLVRRQEPGRNGRARDGEAEEAEQERQRAGEQVDVLPGPEGAPLDLREAVAKRAAEHGPATRFRSQLLRYLLFLFFACWII